MDEKDTRVIQANINNKALIPSIFADGNAGFLGFRGKKVGEVGEP
jgi:hypothetical protein